jgi:hypothetical protein
VEIAYVQLFEKKGEIVIFIEVQRVTSFGMTIMSRHPRREIIGQYKCVIDEHGHVQREGGSPCLLSQSMQPRLTRVFMHNREYYLSYGDRSRQERFMLWRDGCFRAIEEDREKDVRAIVEAVELPIASALDRLTSREGWKCRTGADPGMPAYEEFECHDNDVRLSFVHDDPDHPLTATGIIAKFYQHDAVRTREVFRIEK